MASSLRRVPKCALQQPLAGALVPSEGQQAHFPQGQGRPEDPHCLHPSTWLRSDSGLGFQAPSDLPAASQWTGGGRVRGKGFPGGLCSERCAQALSTPPLLVLYRLLAGSDFDPAPSLPWSILFCAFVLGFSLRTSGIAQAA